MNLNGTNWTYAHPEKLTFQIERIDKLCLDFAVLPKNRGIDYTMKNGATVKVIGGWLIGQGHVDCLYLQFYSANGKLLKTLVNTGYTPKKVSK